ncbi:type IVB secretion system protein IcmH/DotU [Halorhodospira abdelmalekii]|uniref:type IVB secretion system protein IcmH/DotU n=1 Tax=Halorhodospira abdelmalekii TaxID=421629 RepID=UPI00190606F3|nr:type IVB secretion system protein IcmH/DotU [Halorhodospira abdelmalekii]
MWQRLVGKLGAVLSAAAAVGETQRAASAAAGTAAQSGSATGSGVSYRAGGGVGAVQSGGAGMGFGLGMGSGLGPAPGGPARVASASASAGASASASAGPGAAYPGALLEQASGLLTRLAAFRRATWRPASLDAVRAELCRELERLTALMRSWGWSAEATEAARFALVAYSDEAVLAGSAAGAVDESARGHWLAQPLQLELFGEQNAGHHFFERLEALRSDPQRYLEVLKLYCAALQLGFEGAYSLRGEQPLRALEQGLREQIEAFGGPPSLHLPAPPPVPQQRRTFAWRCPYWVLLLLATAIVTAASFYYQESAERAVAAVGAQLVAAGDE